MGHHDAILILIAGFLAGFLVALAAGADNTGIALGVGQLTFMATLVWVLLSD